MEPLCPSFEQVDPATEYKGAPTSTPQPEISISGAPSAAPAGGLPPAAGGPGTGFLSRFGGAAGFLNAYQSGALGGATPLATIAAFQSGAVSFPTLAAQAVREGAQSPSGGAPASSGAVASSRTCPPRMPKIALSPPVKDRIDRYCSRLYEEVSPLGTGAFDEKTWNEFWGLAFKTSEGILLARKLLWFVRGLTKARSGTASTRVPFRGVTRDLLDPDFMTESAAAINSAIPIFGQHLYDEVVQASQPVIGSPFTSDETWEAVRKMRTQLRGKLPDCKTAEGLDGDAFAAFHFLARGLRGRNHRLDLDGVPVDVVYLDLLARGAGPSETDGSANSGATLGRADFYTTEDLRVQREERAAPTGIGFNSNRFDAQRLDPRRKPPEVEQDGPGGNPAPPGMEGAVPGEAGSGWGDGGYGTGNAALAGGGLIRLGPIHRTNNVASESRFPGDDDSGLSTDAGLRYPDTAPGSGEMPDDREPIQDEAPLDDSWKSEANGEVGRSSLLQEVNVATPPKKAAHGECCCKPCCDSAESRS